MRRLPSVRLLPIVAIVAMLFPAAPAAAAEPPWCGDPIPDATAALPDGTDPTHPVGSFPHIPWYAFACTLEDIQSRSDGRMDVKVIGPSALGRDLYLVTINALDTVAAADATSRPGRTSARSR